MPRSGINEPGDDTSHDVVRESSQTPSSTNQDLRELFPGVYAELREAARRQLARRVEGDTLSTTGLVHEAYLKLAAQQRVTWNDRGHLVAIAALAMRHVLVDRAKAMMTQKRGGAEFQITLDDAMIPPDEQPEVMLQLSEAIDELARVDPRLARVVDCRFFGGMREEEIAEAMGITVRTVQRDWAKARTWLRLALTQQ